MIRVICLDGVETIFNFSKVNTIPCMCTATLSLLDSD